MISCVTVSVTVIVITLHGAQLHTHMLPCVLSFVFAAHRATWKTTTTHQHTSWCHSLYWNYTIMSPAIVSNDNWNLTHYYNFTPSAICDLYNQCIYCWSFRLWNHSHNPMSRLSYVVMVCHRLPRVAHIFPWELITGNLGTTATTPLVLTPSGSCQVKRGRAE